MHVCQFIKRTAIHTVIFMIIQYKKLRISHQVLQQFMYSLLLNTSSTQVLPLNLTYILIFLSHLS
jgi:hypothetical protein